MPEIGFLTDLVVVFAVAVVVVALLSYVGIPSIAGFIVAGVLIGPGALGLVTDVHEVEVLAEIGVVLLLFGIGMELSLDKLKRLWQPVVLGGALQMGVTVAATAGIAKVLGLGWGPAVFVGFLVGVSSTAIVLRGLEYRGELDAPHGKMALGILVFQDLSVVPMILAIPLLAGAGESRWTPVFALLKAAGVIVGVIVAARLVVPRLLHVVARTRQRDLFMLAMLLVCIGTAWVVSLAGVSLALGAFLAGLVVAGSEYRHQALADLIPFREILASVFFVSVGMLLDPVALYRDALPVLGLLALFILGKFVIVAAVSLVMRLSLRACILSGAALAQVGEFSFVLMRASDGTGLLDETLGARITSAAILSMLVTPLIIAASPHLAAGVGKLGFLARFMGVRTAGEAPGGKDGLTDHVIIAGYGITGRELAQSLKAASIPYVIAELNATTVREAAREGESIYFGDVTSKEVLEFLGIHDARSLVIGVNDPGAAERTVRAVRDIRKDIPVMVRTRYVADVPLLMEAGATDIVPEEFEAAVELTRRVLVHHGVADDIVRKQEDRMHDRCTVTPPSKPGD